MRNIEWWHRNSENDCKNTRRVGVWINVILSDVGPMRCVYRLLLLYCTFIFYSLACSFIHIFLKMPLPHWWIKDAVWTVPQKRPTNCFCKKITDFRTNWLTPQCVIMQTGIQLKGSACDPSPRALLLGPVGSFAFRSPVINWRSAQTNRPQTPELDPKVPCQCYMHRGFAVHFLL